MSFSTISQLASTHLSATLLYLVAAYVILSMLRQQTTVTFLGYKLLFVIYAGWCLVSHHLDILALILWIVYGGFIVVMFIFAFLWLESRHPLRLHALTTQHVNAAAVPAVIIAVSLGLNPAHYNATSVFAVHWINHYELLHLHNSEEIECLGWALSTDNALPSILVSMLLTASCITAIILIIEAKKRKWVLLKKYLRLFSADSHLITTAVRQQLVYQQEVRNLFKLNRIYIHQHSRRA